MADGDPEHGARLRAIPTLAAISAAEWDACAGASNPFLSHAFLLALEASGSCCAETGWLPQHLVLEDEAGRVIAVAPTYLKSHSYGEYVFDHGWAEAYRRAGGHYYPKLQVAVPFTPVPGRRLLVHPEAPEGTAERLIGGLIELARLRDASSVHVTFSTEAEWKLLSEAGFLARTGHQFHWTNKGYGSFDDFLGDLASRKRKALKKERREAVASGVTMLALTGDAITERHWDAFFGFYMATSDRKWGQAYLNREFFSRLGATLADRVLLVMAEDKGRLVAGALNLIGEDTLYGRNWGCHGDYPFLHFETCYYQAIDFAIARGLKTVEAGAQGEHKLQRGYLPVRTHSAHWIADRALRRAVADYLVRERGHVEQEIEALAEHSPFRRSDADAGTGDGA